MAIIHIIVVTSFPYEGKFMKLVEQWIGTLYNEVSYMP